MNLKNIPEERTFVSSPLIEKLNDILLTIIQSNPFIACHFIAEFKRFLTEMSNVLNAYICPLLTAFEY